MAEIVPTEAACPLDAPPLRLIFRWDGARWAHQIEVAGTLLATSIEWDPETGDPTRVVSPAFQQLSLQEEEGTSRALLVGQWGRHHCSGVFSVRGDGRSASIVADVAIRARGPLTAVASTYSVPLGPGDLQDAGPTGLAWTLGGDDPGRLTFEAGAGPTGRVSLAEAGRRTSLVQVDVPVVAPTSRNSSATHRLVYTWSWTSTRPPRAFPGIDDR